MDVLCESCIVNGERTPATTKSINPDYSAHHLCQACADEYDSRVPSSGWDEEEV